MPTVNISTRSNEVLETLLELKNVTVKCDFFWNSHGKRILWNTHTKERKSWKCASVKIEKYTFTETYSSGSYDFETWRLWVDDKLIAGDIFQYRTTVDEQDNPVAIHIKSDIGWG